MLFYPKDKREILAWLVTRLKELPIGSATTTFRLLADVFSLKQHEHGTPFAFEDLEIDDKGLFDVDFALTKAAEKAGLYLDSSKHWMLVEGLPFNLDFVVSPLKSKVPFTAIQYDEHACPSLPMTLSLNLETRVIRLTDLEKGISGKRHTCNKREWARLTELIDACRFDQWDEKYYEPVLDGTSWSMRLKAGRKVLKESHGDNGFPAAWRIFMALKRECRQILTREMLIPAKPAKCPFCGSTKVKPYLSGMPTAEASASGKYILGGCCITGNEPKWGCEKCQAKFYKGDPCDEDCCPPFGF